MVKEDETLEQLCDRITEDNRHEFIECGEVGKERDPSTDQKDNRDKPLEKDLFRKIEPNEHHEDKYY
ncbi:hypothetical protein [Jeotgalibacillus marinus]|uniref:Uncharacterized protein n=1 Tax=Jeotgalibacillus marinus TaxID=86667 RepID=A0ABV3Q3K6_9BACL